MAHKDPVYLRGRIVARITEYNNSKSEGRGELLTEIQILTNRIESIHSERVEKISLSLEWIVIVLIAAEILIGVVGFRDGQAQQRVLRAIESNTRATSNALEKQQQPVHQMVR